MQAIDTAGDAHDHPDVGAAITGAQRGLHVKALITVNQRQQQLIARAADTQVAAAA